MVLCGLHGHVPLGGYIWLEKYGENRAYEETGARAIGIERRRPGGSIRSCSTYVSCCRLHARRL